VAELHVTLLSCPSCGSPLDGLRRDAVFTCSSCRLALHIREGQVSRHPLRFAPAVSGNVGDIVRLPLWRMELDVASPVDEWSGRRIAWVSGFYQTRVLFFGDPGMDLTERGVEFLEVEEIPAGARLLGVACGPDEAVETARLLITQAIDRRRDVTGMEISIAAVGIELWAVPFVHDAEGGKLEEPNIEKAYSTLLVEDLVEILAGGDGAGQIR